MTQSPWREGSERVDLAVVNIYGGVAAGTLAALIAKEVAVAKMDSPNSLGESPRVGE